ncbi:fimbrial protein [Pseudomonas graminis]
MTCWPQRALLALCSIGLCSVASANLTFNGTLNEPPPCTIDSGSTIEVDFGDVGTKRVDGVKYRRAVGYTIRCSASTLPWLLKLSVKGTETTFDNAALQTTAPDLGIRLYQNSLPFRLNTPLDISLSAPPTLEVVPVKRPGSVLKAQGFTAVATLLAEYQ